jgi:hypothetical protein
MMVITIDDLNNGIFSFVSFSSQAVMLRCRGTPYIIPCHEISQGIRFPAVVRPLRWKCGHDHIGPSRGIQRLFDSVWKSPGHSARSRPVNKSAQLNDDHLAELPCAVLPYLNGFGRYGSHARARSILGGQRRAVLQQYDRLVD